MISNYTIPLTMVALAVILSGCSKRSDDQQTSLPPVADHNPEMRDYLETNVPTRNFLKNLMPEIERNKQLQDAIKAAVTTNKDNKVQAFHEFLSHWHIQWPVIRKDAFGEGGIGFVWDRESQQFRSTADATALIEDRYTLQAILNCDVSGDCANVTFTKLRFHFTEVKAVGVPPEGADEGGARVSYETSSDRWFGLKEWEQLRANWDFPSIGINVVSNKPIPNIRQVFK